VIFFVSNFFNVLQEDDQKLRQALGKETFFLHVKVGSGNFKLFSKKNEPFKEKGIFSISNFVFMNFKHSRCLGVVLVHPVGNASTIMESFKDKFTKWKITNSGENVIAFRKFGHKVSFGVDNLFI